MAWRIVHTIEVVRQSKSWPSEHREDFAMILRVMAYEGPTAFGGIVRTGPYGFVAIDLPSRLVRLHLEFGGAETLIIRGVELFDLPRWT